MKPDGSSFEEAQASPQPQRGQRIFIFSHPRTMSNLFLHFFQNHPQVSVIDYPFDAAYMVGPERLSRRSNPRIDALANARKAADHQATYQSAFDKMLQQIHTAEAQGKKPLIKQPIQDLLDPCIIASNLPSSTVRAGGTTPLVMDRDFPYEHETAPDNTISAKNPTILPASFMRTLTPIILIRHPALMIPSFYRVASDVHGARVDDEDFPVNATLRWSRLIHDYYSHRNNNHDIALCPEEEQQNSMHRQPIIVIDSSRLLADPEAVMRQCCARMGVDPQHLQFQWPRALEKQRGMVSAGTLAFRKDFLVSTGVMRDKAPSRGREVAIEQEVEGWRAEFGEELAGRIEGYVRSAMGDYEYLMQFAV